MIIFKSNFEKEIVLGDYFRIKKEKLMGRNTFSSLNSYISRNTAPIGIKPYLIRVFENSYNEIIIKFSEYFYDKVSSILDVKSFSLLGIDDFVYAIISRDSVKIYVFHVEKSKLYSLYFSGNTGFSLEDVFDADRLSAYFHVFYTSFENTSVYVPSVVELISSSSSVVPNIMKNYKSENLRYIYNLFYKELKYMENKNKELYDNTKGALFIILSELIYCLMLVSKNRMQNIETIKYFKSPSAYSIIPVAIKVVYK